MDLDKLHAIVKKLDAMLTERETGVTSWWIMLGHLIGQIVLIADETLTQD